MMNDELYHFGVKGMKWGVRRKRNVVSTLKQNRLKKKTLVDIHDDYKNAHEKKSISSMSDAELRARINRIQMEQQYAKLNPSTAARGQAGVSAALKTMGSIAATTGTILTIYNNVDKISKILNKTG
jgi:hypothetical protein